MAGIIIFGVPILFVADEIIDTQISWTFDDSIAEQEVSSPSPNRNDDDEGDDYYDDDYYNDENNFGGRQKIGKAKGNTPGDNQVQNKQFKDASKGVPKAKKRVLHDQVTGQGYGYEEIKEHAKIWKGHF